LSRFRLCSEIVCRGKASTATTMFARRASSAHSKPFTPLLPMLAFGMADLSELRLSDLL
jgi:hypothetical protein